MSVFLSSPEMALQSNISEEAEISDQFNVLIWPYGTEMLLFN